jgi:mono/diheme cytochrome c family protein
MRRTKLGEAILCASAIAAALMFLLDANGQAQGANSATTPTSALWAGVYTNEQAARGKEQYEQYCLRCHKRDLSGNGDERTEAPALVGARFSSQWTDRGLSAVFKKMQVEMPPVYSEVVGDDVKIDILAYILKSNGFPAGDKDLTTDTTALDAIRIVPRNAERLSKEPRDFFVVRVEGCLTLDSKQRWALTRATAPVLAEAASAAPVSAGDREYVLIGAKGFNADSLRDHRVAVQGLIATASSDRLIHLTRLTNVDTTCAN